MPKVFTSDKQKIGKMGEDVARKFLMKHGFSIQDQNHTKKWGELDIVATKDKRIHFIEVKSMVAVDLELAMKSGGYRPEDNMHPYKMKRMARTIQTYLLEENIDEDVEWQVDLLLVYMDMKRRKARVKVVSDIIL